MKTKMQSKVNQAPYEEREKNGKETFTDGVLHQTVSQKMKGRRCQSLFDNIQIQFDFLTSWVSRYRTFVCLAPNLNQKTIYYRIV